MARRRGKDTMVRCGLCGRRFPRHQAKIVYRKGVKMYICPKCARFMSLRIVQRKKGITVVPP